MTCIRSGRGTAILEFALAWPVALLLALGCVELAVWGAESYAARSAALATAASSFLVQCANSGTDLISSILAFLRSTREIQ